MILFVFPLLFVVFILAGCKSDLSQSQIETAIAQTKLAESNNAIQATITSTQTQSSTPSVTLTSTSTPTSTYTSTPTPTVTPTVDNRVIDIDPKEFLLSSSDLPQDAKYYLPNSSWISPHRNSEVISGWGVEEGRKYLEETGRVDGWWIDLLRGTKVVTAPEEIYDNIVMYKTSAGALLVITKYSNCLDPENEYIMQETDIKIGDYTNVCIRREMQSSGENRIWYRIEFIYRNFYHGINGYGWEYEVKPEYVVNIAKILLKKLQDAPLSNEVTYRP